MVLPAVARLTLAWNEPQAAATGSAAAGDSDEMAAMAIATPSTTRWRAASGSVRGADGANGSWGDAIAPSLREIDRGVLGGEQGTR